MSEVELFAARCFVLGTVIGIGCALLAAVDALVQWGEQMGATAEAFARSMGLCPSCGRQEEVCASAPGCELGPVDRRGEQPSTGGSGHPGVGAEEDQ